MIHGPLREPLSITTPASVHLSLANIHRSLRDPLFHPSIYPWQWSTGHYVIHSYIRPSITGNDSWAITWTFIHIHSYIRPSVKLYTDTFHFHFIPLYVFPLIWSSSSLMYPSIHSFIRPSTSSIHSSIHHKPFIHFLPSILSFTHSFIIPLSRSTFIPCIHSSIHPQWQ